MHQREDNASYLLKFLRTLG